MNEIENEKWQKLLAMSAPTFAGETTPPFGFVTSTLAGLRAQNSQVQEIERIGWRALLASLAALAIAATLTFTLGGHDNSNDFDPGVRSLVQMQNISVS